MARRRAFVMDDANRILEMAKEEAFGRAEAELRLASVVAISAKLPGLPLRPPNQLPVSVRDPWVVIERVHELGRDFDVDHLVPHQEMQLFIFGHLAQQVASLRQSEATWVSYLCADAFLPLAANFLKWEWARVMPEDCLLMLVSMCTIYPATSGGALFVLAGKQRIVQVLETAIDVILYNPQLIGMSDRHDFMLVRQKALRHTIAVAYTISRRSADAMEGYEPSQEERAAATRLLHHCGEEVQKMMDSLAEVVQAAPMEAIDKWLLVERFSEAINRDPNIPDGIKGRVSEAKRALDAHDAVHHSGLTDLAARMRMS